MKEMRIIEDQLVAVTLKVNKTTDGAVRGWYHILRRLKFRKTNYNKNNSSSVVALALPMLLQR